MTRVAIVIFQDLQDTTDMGCDCLTCRFLSPGVSDFMRPTMDQLLHFLTFSINLFLLSFVYAFLVIISFHS